MSRLAGLVRATLLCAAIAVFPPIAAADPAARMLALNGGDDYEILATTAPRDTAAFAKAAAAAGVPVSRIGTIVSGKGPAVVKDRDGHPIVVVGHSHSHF